MMPEYRKSHHRGKEVKLRDVLHEQLCVPTCIDRTGRVFSKPSNTRKASTENISWAFANKIKKASTLVTDKAVYKSQFLIIFLKEYSINFHRSGIHWNMKQGA